MLLDILLHPLRGTGKSICFASTGPVKRFSSLFIFSAFSLWQEDQADQAPNLQSLPFTLQLSSSSNLAVSVRNPLQGCPQ